MEFVILSEGEDNSIALKGRDRESCGETPLPHEEDKTKTDDTVLSFETIVSLSFGSAVVSGP